MDKGIKLKIQFVLRMTIFLLGFGICLRADIPIPKEILAGSFRPDVGKKTLAASGNWDFHEVKGFLKKIDQSRT